MEIKAKIDRLSFTADASMKHVVTAEGIMSGGLMGKQKTKLVIEIDEKSLLALQDLLTPDE